MNKQLKEDIRKIVGEGKLYEVIISYDKIELIVTKENDFPICHNYDPFRPFTFFEDVTDKKESRFVSEIHDIFGDNIKILAYNDHYVSFKDNNYVFQEEHGYDSYHNRPTVMYITDDDCRYIVCTTDKKAKLKKFNTEYLGDIQIDYE